MTILILIYGIIALYMAIVYYAAAQSNPGAMNLATKVIATILFAVFWLPVVMAIIIAVRIQKYKLKPMSKKTSLGGKKKPAKEIIDRLRGSMTNYPDELERIFEITPAYDKRAEGYGIHGAELRMIVKGERGAVQFVVYTNWQMPHIVKDTINKDYMMDATDISLKQNTALKVNFCPMPADLGYHSPKPMYEHQEPIGSNCPYIKGGVCYYDGSSLNAEPVFDLLVTKGSTAVWEYLEQCYKDKFVK